MASQLHTTHTRMLAFAIAILLLVAQPATAQQQSRCKGSKTHKLVGSVARLERTEHQITGVVAVQDDCTFVVSGFGWDGLAPVTEFWCATSSTSDGRLTNAKQANPLVLPQKPVNGFQTITVELAANLTWDDCPVISTWCAAVSANLGFATLRPGVKSVPGLLPAALVDTGSNCKELLPGKLNLYWKVDTAQGVIKATLQRAIGAGESSDMWMGVGFNDPKLAAVQMVGSDVVVAGMVSGAPFAIDYTLGAQSQCDYSASKSQGVCPDAGGLCKTNPRDPSTCNNVKLLSYDSRGGVVSVTFVRPIKAVDPFDWDWPTASGVQRFLTFATGPLGEASTASQPVVLYHGFEDHAPPTFKFGFGTSGFDCPTAILRGSNLGPSGDVRAPPPAPGPAPSAGGNVLFGRTTITVTTGSNKNYPNPPAWGLSYHLNSLETPVLKVFRNVTYTFSVQAGETHPLYFTTSIVGGASDPTERVFAGGNFSAGTPDKPYLLRWTPGPAVPADIFYQCNEHQKLGWRVKVLDKDDGGPCSKTHPYVGFTGALVPEEHVEPGAWVTILDDCTYRVINLTYDGAAPNVHWVGGTNGTIKAFRAGPVLGPRYTDAVKGQNLTVRLPPGVSWDEINALSLYCTSFDAIMGSVNLTRKGSGALAPPPGALAPPSSRPAPRASPPAPSAGPTTGAAQLPYWMLLPKPTRACAKTGGKVGTRLALTTREHKISAAIVITSACTFTVMAFTSDGQAPDLYFWAAVNGTSDKAYHDGLAIVRLPPGAADGSDPGFELELPGSLNFNDVDGLAVYCRQFKAIMATAALPTSTCGKTKMTGWWGPLVPKEHVDPGSIVTIIDDCTAQVDMFSYDGLAPATYWKLGTADTNAAYKNGTLLQRQTGPVEGATIIIRLPAGMTWDKVGGISLYCQDVDANLASVRIP